MRIVAGKFRRRKLLSTPGQVTRPLPDRVKESLFERLASDVIDKRIADVFAGTGTIGLEALSRGAASVVFFENDKRAFELLKKNVDSLGVGPCAFCWRVDVLRTSFRPKGVDELLPYDTVFFDPPFRMVPDIRPGTPLFRSLERLAREGVTAPNALLVLRTPERSRFTCPPCWQPVQTLGFTTMDVHLFERAFPFPSAAGVRSAARTEQP